MPSNYIICAAGAGSRFEEKFPGTAKAAIKLAGRHLIDWSLDSLPIYADDTLLIITQKAHGLKAKLFDHLANRYRFSRLEWLEIDKLTSGQLETALLAEDLIDKKASISIFNCDTYFQSKTLVSLMNDESIEGIIPSAQVKGDAWSFSKVDDKDQITETAEKKRISDWASVGLYYFRDADKFLKRAKAYVQAASVKETYVAPFYNEYLEAGEKIVIDRVLEFKPMGTPQQIEEYWNLKIDDVVKENYKKVLVVDIDNTITVENPSDPYPEKKPNQALIAKLQEYKDKGYEIILHTARRMRTCRNDESKVLANVGAVTIEWLKKHKVPYDGIKFGKPFAENGFCIDDKTIRPDEFLAKSEEEIFTVIASHEVARQSNSTLV